MAAILAACLSASASEYLASLVSKLSMVSGFPAVNSTALPDADCTRTAGQGLCIGGLGDRLLRRTRRDDSGQNAEERRPIGRLFWKRRGSAVDEALPI